MTDVEADLRDGADLHSRATPGPFGGGRWRLIVAVVVLAAVPFVLGKLFELSTPGPFDSGSYVHSAQRVIDGARIGHEERPSALTGTLLVNMLGVWVAGYSDLGPKLIQTVFQLVALVFMWVVVARLWGRFAAGAAVVLAAFYLSAPVIAKVGNVKEQYMIACMVIGLCCYVLRRLDGHWWWAVLSGAALIWAPLFKPTGFSAGVALVVFMIAGPLFGDRTWRATGRDAGLLLAGATLSLAPVLGWMALAGVPWSFWPFANIIASLIPGPGARPSNYVTSSRELMPLARQLPIMLRFYWVLALPMALGLEAVLLSLSKWVREQPKNSPERADRFVLLFAVWWLLDIALAWVSPRSYEQYFLPIAASGAMLGAYAVATISQRVQTCSVRTRWVVVGVSALLVIFLAHPVVVGLASSQYSGERFPERRYGYLQSARDLTKRWRGELHPAWELTAEAVGRATRPTDRIYVWGWYPGIYVRAQRFSSAPRACEGAPHTMSPEQLSVKVTEILEAFDRTPPAVIIDSRKHHFPWTLPPLELWPRTGDGYLDPRPDALPAYDAVFSRWLGERFGHDVAERYRALAPLRRYVVSNYLVAAEYGEFLVLSRRQGPPGTRPDSRPRRSPSG